MTLWRMTILTTLTGDHMGSHQWLPLDGSRMTKPAYWMDEWPADLMRGGTGPELLRWHVTLMLLDLGGTDYTVAE